MDYFRSGLPKTSLPTDRKEWNRRVARIRQGLVANVFLRGHAPGILAAPPKVEWRGVLETGKGYRIRKLRYEGYPGMWIPALLYEPDDLRGRVPAVLNPNGHHLGGKAMPYKQARCINLVRRGMLALNTEFVGMGELQGSLDHQAQAHIDLCGVSGVGVMYLAMKRGLDVLLAHKHSDPDRVAMTGLSGGGWQTAVLSAMDVRVGVIAPVAGHSPVWQRTTEFWPDMGDMEQTPADLCVVADYDTLTAMFAPRPALLIHNADDVYFRPEFVRPSLLVPAKRVYSLFGAEEDINFHVNESPGDHNYERENREQFYRLLNRAWGLEMPTEDILCEEEMFSEWELNVGLPPDNPTLLSLAGELAGPLPRVRSSRSTAREDRIRLKEVLRLPSVRKASVIPAGTDGNLAAGFVVRHHVLQVGHWRVPMTEFARPSAGHTVLILCERGRAEAAKEVKCALQNGQHVFVVDLFGFGEQVVSSIGRNVVESHTHGCFMACVSSAGDRPLGICVSQLLSTVSFIRTHAGERQVALVAGGLSTSVVALCAAALKPGAIRMLRINLPDSLRRLVDWPVHFNDHPVVFCFGLLEQFDVEDLITLSYPVDIENPTRGLMRSTRH